jgi:hypothetical protein
MILPESRTSKGKVHQSKKHAAMSYFTADDIKSPVPVEWKDWYLTTANALAGHFGESGVRSFIRMDDFGEAQYYCVAGWTLWILRHEPTARNIGILGVPGKLTTNFISRFVSLPKRSVFMPAGNFDRGLSEISQRFSRYASSLLGHLYIG